MLSYTVDAAYRQGSANDRKALGGDFLLSPTASPADLPMALVERMQAYNVDAAVSLSSAISARMSHLVLQKIVAVVGAGQEP